MQEESTPTKQYVLSRECDACCGLLFDGTTLHKDPTDPMSLGLECVCLPQALKPQNRITTPQKNHQELSWEQAFGEISAHIEQNRRQDLSQVGLYLDNSVFRRGNDWVQALCFAGSLGTKSIFTDQCRYDSARLLVTEWMIGHATPLLSDLERSHYILHLGSDHRKGSWGGLQLGMAYERQIEHSRKTKGTKLIVVNDTKSSYAKEADSFVSIRPGTEPFLLLGLLHISLKSGWMDKQYVEKYTLGFDELFPLLESYTVDRCAAICGIKSSVLSGIALKFTRAPMAVIHPNSGTFSNANATLGAWAWMALHTISANALRPGGIYENVGSIDLVPLLASLRSNDAPRSTVGQQPLLLMQNMGSQLLEEIEQGNISVLIVAASDVQYPQRQRLFKALRSLECLVVISEKETELTEIADYVLPRSASWEEDDLMAHRNICLPFYAIPYSKAIRSPVGESKSLTAILQELRQHLSFGFRSSPFGIHLRTVANLLARGSVERKIRSMWNLLNEEDIPSTAGLHYMGESNRAEWRPVDGKIQLAPTELSRLFEAVHVPTPTEEHPFLLRTSTYIRNPRENAVAVVQAHPDLGFADKAPIWMESLHGKIEATVEVTSDIRTDSLQCSFWENPTVLSLLPTQTDSWSGTPVLDGVPCAIYSRSE